MASSELDGVARRRIADDIWRGWRENQEGAVLLTGASGLGKSNAIIGPLLRRSRAEGHRALLLEVPLDSPDLEQELVGLLSEAAREAGDNELAARAAACAAFGEACLLALQMGCVLVIDEGQRLLGPGGRALEPVGAGLAELARRPEDGGALWLVANRVVDPALASLFIHHEVAPPEEDAAVEIVLRQLEDARADQFPAERRTEVVRRLGSNPRVLVLLGHLLNVFNLSELLGAASGVPEIPAEAAFVEAVERELVAKALEGLDSATVGLLRDLTVLHEGGPWGVVAAVSRPHGSAVQRLAELRERFLLEVHGGRYTVNPAAWEALGAMLREDVPAWRDAHLRAGTWFAASVDTARSGSSGDALLSRGVVEATFHLNQAGEADRLRDFLQTISPMIDRRYGWSAAAPSSAGEADARIALLRAFLHERSDHPGVHNHLARLLGARDRPGDLALAIHHSEIASQNQDSAETWVLLIKLVYRERGASEALVVARRAVETVSPERGLFSIYQLWASILNQEGEADAAVDVLLDGYRVTPDGMRRRLIESALFVAAGDDDAAPFARVASEATAAAGALARVLALEREGAWEEAAVTAGSARTAYPTHLPLMLHETLSWLGARRADLALASVSDFPYELRVDPRSALAWLLACTHLADGDLEEATSVASIYFDGEDLGAPEALGAGLIDEWDQRVGPLGEQTPAFYFPLLPAALMGDVGSRRASHRPSDDHGPGEVQAREGRPRRYLAVATEWGSGHGGLSTFNRQLCRALSAAGADVTCLVLQAEPEALADAERAGVRLVEPPESPGLDGPARLGRRPAGQAFDAPDAVIGHGRITGPYASQLAEDVYPAADRVHVIHMAPDEIEWYKDNSERDPAALAEERTRIEVDLARSADRAFAVGPRLFNRFLTELSPFGDGLLVRLDPGFDADLRTRRPPPGSPLRVLMFGRTDDPTLKGVDFGASALSAALRDRPQTGPVELRIRGAVEGEGEQLRDRIVALAGGMFECVVRNYTTDTNELRSELERASLVLMPSRSEGFGLVGLEAIVQGTPVIVSASSGLGELLGEVLGDKARAIVAKVGTEGSGREWADAIARVLDDRDGAFEQAAQVRELMARARSWLMTAQTVQEAW